LAELLTRSLVKPKPVSRTPRNTKDEVVAKVVVVTFQWRPKVKVPNDSLLKPT